MKKFFKNSFVLLLAVMMAASFLGCTPGTGNTQGAGNTPGTGGETPQNQAEQKKSKQVERCVLKFSGVTNNTMRIDVSRKGSDDSDYRLINIIELQSFGEESAVSYPIEYSFTDDFVEPNKAYEYKYTVVSKTWKGVNYTVDDDGVQVFIPSEGFGELTIKDPYSVVTYDDVNKKLLFSADGTVNVPSGKYYKNTGVCVFYDDYKKYGWGIGNATEMNLTFWAAGTYQITGYSMIISLKYDDSSYPKVNYVTKPIDISSKNITFTKE